jgi:ABC-2 type transport system ATP-binding protein
MLEVKNICKSFGSKKALNNVGFTVKKGQIVALLGENGAGKSTLLRILSGFYAADCGEVILNGLNLDTNRLSVLQQIGYVQEISALYPEMKVYEFLCFVADIRQLPVETKISQIKTVIAALELTDVLNQKNETLSKGYKKRVELAAMLISEPAVLLLDEPTEGLDPNQKHALRQIIKQYAKTHMVIISTHTLEDVEALASRVLLLHKGNLEADSELKTFKKTADNDLLKSFRKITEN